MGGRVWRRIRREFVERFRTVRFGTHLPVSHVRTSRSGTILALQWPALDCQTLFVFFATMDNFHRITEEI